jgi:hypothetical protein
LNTGAPGYKVGEEALSGLFKNFKELKAFLIELQGLSALTSA